MYSLCLVQLQESYLLPIIHWAESTPAYQKFQGRHVGEFWLFVVVACDEVGFWRQGWDGFGCKSCNIFRVTVFDGNLGRECRMLAACDLGPLRFVRSSHLSTAPV